MSPSVRELQYHQYCHLRCAINCGISSKLIIYLNIIPHPNPNPNCSPATIKMLYTLLANPNNNPNLNPSCRRRNTARVKIRVIVQGCSTSGSHTYQSGYTSHIHAYGTSRWHHDIAYNKLHLHTWLAQVSKPSESEWLVVRVQPSSTKLVRLYVE